MTGARCQTLRIYIERSAYYKRTSHVTHLSAGETLIRNAFKFGAVKVVFRRNDSLIPGEINLFPWRVSKIFVTQAHVYCTVCTWSLQKRRHASDLAVTLIGPLLKFEDGSASRNKTLPLW